MIGNVRVENIKYFSSMQTGVPFVERCPRTMDQDTKSLRTVAALEKECRELSIGLHWAIERLGKKKLMRAYQSP
jgi:hypothetical protein